jgi:beta-xylosidase
MRLDSLSQTVAGLAPHSGNPIIPGYYADPSLVQYDGKFYVYATLDPWGGDTLGCWESGDFQHWTYRVKENLPCSNKHQF